MLLAVPFATVVFFFILDFYSVQATMHVRPSNVEKQLNNFVNLNDVQFYFTADMRVIIN